MKHVVVAVAALALGACGSVADEAPTQPQHMVSIERVETSDGVLSLKIPSDWQDVDEDLPDSFVFGRGSTDGDMSLFIQTMGDFDVFPGEEEMVDQLISSTGYEDVTYAGQTSVAGFDAYEYSVTAEEFKARLLYLDIDGAGYEVTANTLPDGDFSDFDPYINSIEEAR